MSVKTGRGNTEVWLDPGQMIFGRYAVAKKLKQKPSALYTRLKKLEKLGNCNTRNNTHFTIVTVIKWSSYAEHIIPIATRKTTPKQHANNTKNHDNHEDMFAPSREENGSEQQPRDVIISIPLIAKDGEFPIYQTDIDEWQSVYPGVLIPAELKKIRLWNQDNPTKRKTKKGIRRHISSWLDRAQNGSRGTAKPPTQEQPYPYRELN